MKDEVSAAELYLDLMKRALVGLLYDEDKSFRPINRSYPRRFHKRWALNFVSKFLAKTDKQIAEPVRVDLERRLHGIDWPPPVCEGRHVPQHRNHSCSTRL